MLGIGKRERGKQYPFTERPSQNSTSLSDVDRDTERKGEKACQQRPVYQQDVFTVRSGPPCYSASLTALFRGDSVILGIVNVLSYCL